jgi:hypothetical protein
LPPTGDKPGRKGILSVMAGVGFPGVVAMALSPENYDISKG